MLSVTVGVASDNQHWHANRIGQEPVLHTGALRSCGFEPHGMHPSAFWMTSSSLRKQDPAEPNRCGSTAVNRVARRFESSRLDCGVMLRPTKRC